jgi:lantibiotic biosynthesis protein
VDRKGLDEAIDRLATWLATHRLDDRWGINWPSGVGLLAQNNPAGRIADVNTSPRAQAGWCYGSPGVARSLHFAGLALQKPEYCDLANESIESVLRRPIEVRIVMRFANDTSATSMRAGATALTRQLLRLYEPDSLLGFRSVGIGDNRVDQPGLLDGAPGVALVLLAAAGAVEPGWDRMFLLS